MGFTELKPFTRLWRQLGLTDDDLLAVQMAVIKDPQGSPVISGTGGLRKLRFSPRRSATGKRDAMRVCYVYFPIFRRVILTAVYPKNVQDDLSSDEKKVIRDAIGCIEKELLKSHSKSPRS